MQASGPGLLSLLWFLLLAVGLPLASAPRVQDPTVLPRRFLYLSTVAGLWALSLLTGGVAWWEGISTADLNLAGLPPAAFASWAGGTFVAGLLVGGGLLLAQMRAGHPEPPVVEHLMPRTASDQNLFLLVAFSAGVCEEWIFRGFALEVLEAWTGSLWIAVLVQAIVFGLAHSYQSRWGLLRAGSLGLVLALPPVLTGSLWPSALAHMLLDVAAGLWFWPRYGSALKERSFGTDGAGQDATTPTAGKEG